MRQFKILKNFKFWEFSILQFKFRYFLKFYVWIQQRPKSQWSSVWSSLFVVNPNRIVISTWFSHKPPKLPLSSAFAISPLSTATATDVRAPSTGPRSRWWAGDSWRYWRRCCRWRTRSDDDSCRRRRWAMATRRWWGGSTSTTPGSNVGRRSTVTLTRWTGFNATLGWATLRPWRTCWACWRTKVPFKVLRFVTLVRYPFSLYSSCQRRRRGFRARARCCQRARCWRWRGIGGATRCRTRKGFGQRGSCRRGEGDGGGEWRWRREEFSNSLPWR